MCEPTACARVRPRPDSCHPRPIATAVTSLVGLDGFHVLEVAERVGTRGPWLRVVVESPATVMGCPRCGVVVGSYGRRDVTLIDTPCFGRPVRLVWRKRTWRCVESSCRAVRSPSSIRAGPSAGVGVRPHVSVGVWADL